MSLDSIPTPGSHNEGPRRQLANGASIDSSVQNNEDRKKFVLKVQSVNRPGLVAKLSDALYKNGYNILNLAQHDDVDTKKFFMRLEFESRAADNINNDLKGALTHIAATENIEYTLRDAHSAKSVLILVSRFDHCLADLIYRSNIGELNIRIVGIIANYPKEIYAKLPIGDIPFHYLPVTPETKLDQEQKILSIADETRADLVILARYMQILSDEASRKLSGRCINIHHSFLPGFKGAKPYHQAHEKGVKLIGATAHYVTGDLDEGPIIEQDVERICHSDGPDNLVRKGRDIERRVLARAVRYHLEDRVMLNGSRTVVFPD